MKRANVIIAIEPGRLEIIAPARSLTKRFDISASDDPSQWLATLAEIKPAFTEWTEQNNLTGSRAVVVYRSHTQAVDVVSTPNARGAFVSRGEAMETARLGCTNALPYSPVEAICEATVAGHDRVGDARQTHVVVVAERNDVSAAIIAFLESAEYCVASITPFDGITLTRLVGRAIDESHGLQGWLHVGEQNSFFVLVHDGAILFQRHIDVGIESMITAMTRPILTAQREHPIELSRDDAHQILFEHGVPDFDVLIREDLDLYGKQILPVLRPVLQRMTVELRQSLRFGLKDHSRGELELVLTGQGSTMPRLCEVLSAEMELSVSTDSTAGQGEIEFIRQSMPLLNALNVMPIERVMRREKQTLRRCLFAGVFAAMTLMGIDGVQMQQKIEQLRAQVSLVETGADDAEAMELTRDRLSRALAAMSDLESRIDTTVGFHVNHRACLQELSLIASNAVRLDEIQFTLNEGVTHCRLRGMASRANTDEKRTALEAFVQRIKSSPLFMDVALKGVRVDHSDVEGSGEAFEIECVAVDIPPHRAIAAVMEQTR